ncbi:MAG TPA: flagellar assembly protein FliW [Atribacteraceae bacterium]|nr:flagellar assembly protein FliW [Atribacteraceae bacterium]
MLIETLYFGPMEVEPEKLILFPWGLPGFEEYKRFILLEEEGFLWLQSADSSEVVFALCDPFLYFRNYEIDIPTADCGSLAIIDHENVIVLSMMNVLSPTEIGVNLLAPLVINCQLRMGKQVILENSAYRVRHILQLDNHPEDAGVPAF